MICPKCQKKFKCGVETGSKFCWCFLIKGNKSTQNCLCKRCQNDTSKTQITQKAKAAINILMRNSRK